MKRFLTMYLPGYARTLIYMLQSTEYEPSSYLNWFWRVRDFSNVANRRSLDKTKIAKLLQIFLIFGIFLQLIVGAGLLYLGYNQANPLLLGIGLLVILSYPYVWAYLMILPIILGRLLIINPKEEKLILRSKQIFAEHQATKIAVAGSYGKTTMKELLGTVLAEGKNVAITPANKNVAISHAIFAKNLSGEEEVLVIEFGEGKPGDVARFSDTVRPNIGVITGIAPAHLDHYPNLDAAAEDIFSLSDYTKDGELYVNADSEQAKPYVKENHIRYSIAGVDGWTVSDIKVGFDGTEFKLAKDSRKLRLKTGLLGRHQIGPLVAVVDIADKLGLSEEQIVSGIAKTRPFEHRMEARSLHGAWILDDTYNGNIDGLKAGLALLSELPAKRKIYVTPGLVDQGIETEKVHIQLGEEIARISPDVVVLMQNSVTDHITRGMNNIGYDGDLRIESNPLEFYLGLEHILANGDVVLMQNDWTDNYN